MNPALESRQASLASPEGSEQSHEGTAKLTPPPFQLMASPVDPPSTPGDDGGGQNNAQTIQKKDAPGSNAPVAQAKMRLRGGDIQLRRQFVDRINQGSPVKFQLNEATGHIELQNPSAVGVDEYTTQLIAAVNNVQNVDLSLVRNSATVMDSFTTGEVDTSDMFSGTPEMFRLNLLHFIVERFSMPKYEATRTNTLQTTFDKAHFRGIQAEERYLRQLHPGKNIRFVRDFEDLMSLNLNGSHDGTVNYIFDFTDVEYILVQEVIGGNRTGVILSSRVRVKV